MLDLLKPHAGSNKHCSNTLDAEVGGSLCCKVDLLNLGICVACNWHWVSCHCVLISPCLYVHVACGVNGSPVKAFVMLYACFYLQEHRLQSKMHDIHVIVPCNFWRHVTYSIVQHQGCGWAYAGGKSMD